jgi:glutaredoxin-like protein
MLDKNTAQKAKELLGGLKGKVKLAVFTQETECMFCAQNRELAQDMAGLSDKISIEVYDLLKDEGAAERWGIDKIPALAVTGENKDYGIRFFGIPSGYEFISLIEAVRLVSSGEHGLSDDTVRRVSAVKTPVHIQVFVTPTCPYCPRAVVLAHKLALLSENVRADMIEAIEFPHLVNKYAVMGVPKSVINESHFVEGAVPEKAFVDKLLGALENKEGP